MGGIFGNIKYMKKAPWLLWCFIFLYNCWSFSWIDNKIFQYIHLIIITFFIITIFNTRKGKNHAIFSKQIKLFIILPLLSIPACYILNGQAIENSIIVYRMHLGWLLYFVLYAKKTTEEQIIRVITCMALIYAFLVLIQQVTYPFAPWGERTLGTLYAENFANGVERRFGFYRFMVSGHVFAFFALLLIIAHRWETKKIIVVFLILSIIATGNRQTIVSAFAAISFYYIFSKDNKNKLLYICLLVILFITFSVYGNEIMGDRANISEDLEEGRMHSYIYYYDKITDNYMAFFWGNGLPSPHSLYGKTPDYFMNKPVTPSDIGMLGTWYYWGGIYVCTYLFFMIRLLFNKHLDLYLKSFVLFFLLTIWVSTPLWEIWGMASQALFIYYCELNIRKNKPVFV